MSTTLLPRPTREEVINAILSANPHLIRGEDMTHATNMVNGEGQINSGFELGEEITAQSFVIKLPLNSQAKVKTHQQGQITDLDDGSLTLENFIANQFEGKKFLHFYTVSHFQFPNPNLAVGDTINAMEPDTFDLVERIVTQDDIDLWNRIHVRLTVS